MTLPSKFWHRLHGLILVVCGLAITFGLDSGTFNANWWLRIANIAILAVGVQFLVFGMARPLQKDELDGMFPFWRKK